MYGGHFGTRIVTWRGRWRLVTDIRGITLTNFQDRRQDLLIETNSRNDVATYDDDGNLDDVTIGGVASSETRELIGTNHNRFVYGGELRMEAIFDLTRNFALTSGFELLVLADGLGRGIFTTDEAFLMGGATFGFTINH